MSIQRHRILDDNASAIIIAVIRLPNFDRNLNSHSLESASPILDAAIEDDVAQTDGDRGRPSVAVTRQWPRPKSHGNDLPPPTPFPSESDDASTITFLSRLRTTFLSRHRIFGNEPKGSRVARLLESLRQIQPEIDVDFDHPLFARRRRRIGEDVSLQSDFLAAAFGQAKREFRRKLLVED